MVELSLVLAVLKLLKIKKSVLVLIILKRLFFLKVTKIPKYVFSHVRDTEKAFSIGAAS